MEWKLDLLNNSDSEDRGICPVEYFAAVADSMPPLEDSATMRRAMAMGAGKD